MIAHLWRLSLSFMLSLFEFIFIIGLAFEIVRIIILVFEIVEDLLRRVYPYHCDSWKLYIKIQMISFVFYRLLLLLLRLFAESALCLFGGDSKHLRWEA